jgi:hypothetical protein
MNLFLIPTYGSAQAFHDLFERFPARPDPLEREARQRLVDDVQLRQEVVAIGLDVDQPGRELAAPGRLVQALERADLVGRIVAFFQLLQESFDPSCIVTSWTDPGS